MARNKKDEESKVDKTEDLDNVKTENEKEITSTGETADDLKGDAQPAPITVEALKVQIAFSDKYTDEDYPVGHVLENLSEERYNELINDPRKLVCKNY